MNQENWRQSVCILCHSNCGVEVQLDGRSISRVHGDKANPGSHGYLCQKAQRLSWYANHDDRLTTPLKRLDNGSLAAIPWDQAISEISQKLTNIRDQFGAKTLAYYGGGGQGNHMGGAYGVSFMRALGSKTVFNSLGQERTGDYWVNGHMFGAQNCNPAFQLETTDLAVFIGANPWMSNAIPAARPTVNAIAKDPARRMIVIDPVRTRTAEKADVHLQLRPGTDAFLLGAMLAMLQDCGGFDDDFLATRTTGAETVRACLAKVPVAAWLQKADVELADAQKAVQLIAETKIAGKSMSVRADLGILQSPNSTLNSWLEKLLAIMTGQFNRSGTNALHGWLQPLWGNSKGAQTAVTGMPEIGGIYPPNRFPAEVMSDHPDHLRAVIVDSSNPANSAADSQRMEEAFQALDLLVVVDVALTETAQLADYVLPAAAQMEKWEFTLFTFEFPDNVIQLRDPLFEPLGECLPEPEIYNRLAKASGLLPDEAICENLRQTAATDRTAFAADFGGLLKNDPVHAALAPIILYQTLGQTLAGGAAGAAVLWPACHRVAGSEATAIQRALKTEATGAALGEVLFDRILTSRSGLVFMSHNPEDAWRFLRNKDGRIHLAIPEMVDWLTSLDTTTREPDAQFPFVLMAGQRRSYNVNQIMRHPAWRRSEQEGTLRIRADDLAKIDGIDGGWVTASTAAGQITLRAEIDDTLRPGVVAAPHGYGMAYPDGKGGRVTVGPRINQLSSIEDCDPVAATPHHKAIPVNLRRAGNEEADKAEADVARMNAVISAAS